MGANRIETEYNEINSKDGWTKTFQEIKEKSEKEATEKKFTLNECNKFNNRRLNRYRDVSPYDHTRIILQRGNIDYINANLVKMERAHRKYILTQGPLENTVGHFWLMVWEQNCAAILMLNKVIEKKQIKCHQYWPDDIGEEHLLTFDDVGLTLEYLKCENYTNFSIRTFRLTDIESAQPREVIQFHYTTWPDFYVPSSPLAFLHFLKKVRDSGALNADVGPAVVHCSAGIGRSGTFCLVDSCLVLVEKEGENKINVTDLLLELRQSRMGLIQTADQLYFSYQAIIEGIRHLNDPTIFDNEETPIIANEAHNAKPEPPKRASSLTLRKPLPSIPIQQNDEAPSYDKRALPPTPRNDDDISQTIDESPGESDSNEADEEIEEAYSDEDENGDEDGIKDKLPLPPYTENDKLNDDSNDRLANNESPLSADMKNSSDVLRQRKQVRQERKSAMEDKIKDIKRKQAEVEAAAEAAPKKRRHLLQNESCEENAE